MARDVFQEKQAQWYYRSGRKLSYLLVLMALVSSIWYGKEKYLEWEEIHSGIPDAVSNMSINNEYYLKVVANSSQIEDKEALAREIIRMCQDNSFRSIYFSTDLNGYPSELNISVFLNQRGLERGEPVFEIEFSTDDFRGQYDIKNDTEQYHLYLDGKEIDFFDVE